MNSQSMLELWTSCMNSCFQKQLHEWKSITCVDPKNNKLGLACTDQTNVFPVVWHAGSRLRAVCLIGEICRPKWGALLIASLR